MQTVGPSVRGVNLLLLSLGAIIIAYLWLEELLDLPWFFGFKHTPVNWVESLMETVVIILAAAVVIGLSNRLLKRIAYLEGFHTICAHCKRIRVGTQWLTVEQYMQRHSSLRLSHSICPECAKHHFDYDETEEQQHTGEPNG